MKFRKKNNQEFASYDGWRRHALRDAKVRAAYDALQPKYALIHDVLDARLKQGLTQEEVARRAGTTQSAIARFESGAGNPTIDFLSKVSIAIGARLEIRLAH